MTPSSCCACISRTRATSSSARTARSEGRRAALEEHVAEDDPRVVIFDLAPPYDKSWTFLQHVRNHPSMKKRSFVLTSTNPERVHQIAGDSEDEPILEIIGYDLQQVVSAVKKAIDE